jgi:hypothetical protein
MDLWYSPPELRRVLPQFRIPRFTRTLSSWLNLLVETGCILKHCDEPNADAELARQPPEWRTRGLLRTFSLCVAGSQMELCHDA